MWRIVWRVRDPHISLNFLKVIVLSMIMTASQDGSLCPCFCCGFFPLAYIESHHKRLFQGPSCLTHLVCCLLCEGGTESTSFRWRGLWEKGGLVVEILCFCWAANLIFSFGHRPSYNWLFFLFQVGSLVATMCN